jgi:hypothetical protein
LDLAGEVFGAQAQVDESRAGDLGVLEQLALVEAVDEQLRDFARGLASTLARGMAQLAW